MGRIGGHDGQPVGVRARRPSSGHPTPEPDSDRTPSGRPRRHSLVGAVPFSRLLREGSTGDTTANVRCDRFPSPRRIPVGTRFGSIGRSTMRLDLDGTGRPVGPEVTDDEPRLSGRAFGTPLECSPNPCRSVVLPVGVLRVDEYAVLGEDRAHVVFVPVLEGPQYRFDVFAFYPRHGTVTRRDRSGSRLDRAFVRSFVAWSSNPEHTPVFENPDARYVVHRVVPLATASPWRNPARRSAGRVRRVETRSFDAFAARSTLTARPLAV